MKAIALVGALAACALAQPAVAAADGKTVYGQTCAACHASGLAGAPKIGDKTAWAPRTGAGKGGLMASVLKGKGAMPPKAGNASLTDEEIGAAIDYMLEQLR